MTMQPQHPPGLPQGVGRRDRRGGAREHPDAPRRLRRRRRHDQDRPDRLRRPRERRGVAGAAHQGPGQARSPSPTPSRTTPRPAFENLKTEHGDKVDVEGDHIFHGFDAYKKAIDAGPDLVILATPPGFRPIHFEYAVKAGKHIFMEKPVATDAAGVRRFLAAAEEAKKKNLKVGVGLQRHHQARLHRDDQAHPGRRRSASCRCSASTGTAPAPGSARGKEPKKAKPARPDRDGVPDAQLVLLQLAVRRPHRRAAHPQPRRHQLGQEGPTRPRPRARAGGRSAPATTTARSTTTTSSSSPTPTAHVCSASAATSRARGTASPSTRTAPRGTPTSAPARSSCSDGSELEVPRPRRRTPTRSSTTTSSTRSATTSRTTRPSTAPTAR